MEPDENGGIVGLLKRLIRPESGADIAASVAVGSTPIASTAMDIGDVGYSLSNREWLNAGIAALGASLPLVSTAHIKSVPKLLGGLRRVGLFENFGRKYAKEAAGMIRDAQDEYLAIQRGLRNASPDNYVNRLLRAEDAGADLVPYWHGSGNMKGILESGSFLPQEVDVHLYDPDSISDGLSEVAHLVERGTLSSDEQVLRAIKDVRNRSNPRTERVLSDMVFLSDNSAMSDSYRVRDQEVFQVGSGGNEPFITFPNRQAFVESRSGSSWAQIDADRVFEAMVSRGVSEGDARSLLASYGFTPEISKVTFNNNSSSVPVTRMTTRSATPLLVDAGFDTVDYPSIYDYGTQQYYGEVWPGNVRAISRKLIRNPNAAFRSIGVSPNLASGIAALAGGATVASVVRGVGVEQSGGNNDQRRH